MTTHRMYVCSICAILFLLGILCNASAAPDFDVSNCVIDGALLTRNWDARYTKATPVAITVKGKTADEAVFLVDGDRNRGTALSWNKGDEVDVVIDLERNQLVMAICLSVSGDASWQVGTSIDGKNWNAVPTRLVQRTSEYLLIPNLARLSRFVRLMAVPKSDRLFVGEIFVYGEENSKPTLIGGIYPSTYPPVVGKTSTLRAVLRNFTPKAMTNLNVQFSLKVAGTEKLAACKIARIEPGQSAIAAIPWTPDLCEPHKIRVKLGKSERTETIPVVNRALYFGCFSPPNYEMHPALNLFTCIGDATGTDAPQYSLIKLHGGIGLSDSPGTTGSWSKKTADEYEKLWGTALSIPYRDGIAMDEWGYPNTEADEAMKRLSAVKNDKLLVAWMATSIREGHYQGLRYADMAFLETYCNMLGHGNWEMGHNFYRPYIRRAIEHAKTENVLDRSIVALGYFVDMRPTIPEELEREVRYVRTIAPEIPGMVYYGLPWRKSARIVDDLSYKYFIAPVVQIKEVKLDGSTATVELTNIGGMNAHNVQVEFIQDTHQKSPTRKRIDISAGGNASLKFDYNTTGEKPRVVVVPSDKYTSLEEKPFEILPAVQAKGNPLQASWDSQQVKLKVSDRVEFVNRASNSVVQSIKANDFGNFSIFARTIKTDDLTPGSYLVRLVDGDTGELKGSDEIIITDPNAGTGVQVTARASVLPAQAKLYADAVNGAPWKGDPRRIEVKAGDNFDLRYDLTGSRIPSPVICISAPGEPLRMPLSEGGYVYADISRFFYMAADPLGEPFQKGVWKWSTNPKAEDFLSAEDFNGITNVKGWIRDSKGLNEKNPKVNMSLTLGEWHLWIATESDVVNLWAAPKSPVLTVVVR